MKALITTTYYRNNAVGVHTQVVDLTTEEYNNTRKRFEEMNLAEDKKMIWGTRHDIVVLS